MSAVATIKKSWDLANGSPSTSDDGTRWKHPCPSRCKARQRQQREAAVYIIGGRDADRVARSDVQRFAVNGTWNEAFRKSTPMGQRRWATAAVALDGGDSILVCGGSYFDGSSDVILNTCEKYEVANDSWSPFPHMERERYSTMSITTLLP